MSMFETEIFGVGCLKDCVLYEYAMLCAAWRLQNLVNNFTLSHRIAVANFLVHDE
jgi:hypothetical protein